MAGISQVYQDLKAKISTATGSGFVHIWNNQLEQLAEGKTYAFPFPCYFIEVMPPTQYDPIGRGYATGELTIKIHIGHEEYDAFNGNYEENVNVFTLRDGIINALNSYQPIACSSLMKISETQDYVHTNIYHYVIEFKCAFIDSRGSIDEQLPFVDGSFSEIDINAFIDTSLANKFDLTFDNTFNL